MLASLISKTRLKVIIFLVFTLISCIPVFILAYWVSETAAEREIQSVEEKHLIIAGSISRAYERYARDVTSVFDRVSKRLDAGESIIDDTQLLKGMDVSDLCVVNQNNKLIGALNYASICEISLDQQKIAELRQQSRTEVDTSTLSRIHRVNNRPVLLLTRILMNGNLAIASLELDYLIAIQKSIAFGERGHSMVVDALGRVIAHPNAQWEANSKDASPLSVVQKMMAGETGVSTFYSPPMQADMIAGHTSVPGTGWGVMVPQPLSELMDEVARVKRIALLISLFGVLVAALLSWLVARALANPIESVTFTARAIAGGDRSVEVPDSIKHTARELRELRIYFNRMINHMRHTHNDLENHRNNLEGLVQDRTVELMREMQERQHAEQVVQQEKERLGITLESIGDGVITTDANYRVDYLNPVAEALTGWSLSEAQGEHLSKVISFIDSLTSDIIQLKATQHSANKRYEGLLIRRDGKTVDVQKTVARIMSNQGELEGLVLVVRDVTENRKLALKLSYEASHDPLTSLFNRRAFEEKASEAIESARQMNKTHVLCYLDMDQFKIVNDTCGHGAGDEMLCQLAELMRQSMRHSDLLARLGGDEFGIVFLDCSLEKAQQIATNICKNVQEFRFNYDGHSFRVGVSIGLTLIDSESNSLSTILKEADSACYLAKERGRNRIETWEPTDAGNMERASELQWVGRINTALDEDLFELYIQPITPISNEGDQANLYELLIRLPHESGEVTLPGSFLPAAARYKLLPKVDRWVLATAFAWLKDEQPELGSSRISINITGETLSDPDFLPYVKRLFEEYKVDGNALIIEITENSALNNLQAALRFMSALKELGCKFALDDFGTGFSSLGNLKQLPVDYIKIDGNFVRDMAKDAIDEVMVRSICEIGQTLEKLVVAEFVETEEIEQLLQTIGVDFAQGYHIGRPSPLKEFNTLSQQMQKRIANS